MIRRPTISEQIEDLPPLTEEEKATLDTFDMKAILAKVEAELPPAERKQFKVTDCWGNTIQRFKTAEEAFLSCMMRNVRAKRMGLWMRYRTAKDQGWDE